MATSAFPDWFWPSLSLLLFVLWMWALLRPRRATPASRSAVPEQRQRTAEVEDALKATYILHEAEGSWDSKELGRSMGLSNTMASELAGALFDYGWAQGDVQGQMRLTEAGEARARELIRTHRLWERYLVDKEGTPLERVHAEAHLREHQTTPEEVERLDVALGHPAWDPHGHAIPASGCQVPSVSARSLLEEGTPGSRLRVICLDDEPAALLAQLVAMGLEPGVDVEVLERQAGLLRVKLGEQVVPLAGAAARHVAVVPVPALPVPLGELPMGSRARVVEVKGGGIHQRRMLDMGLVPGAEVTVIREAPLGDPIEYSIKGTAIAMRRTDASSIMVEEVRDG